MCGERGRLVSRTFHAEKLCEDIEEGGKENDLFGKLQTIPHGEIPDPLRDGVPWREEGSLEK